MATRTGGGGQVSQVEGAGTGGKTGPRESSLRVSEGPPGSAPPASLPPLGGHHAASSVLLHGFWQQQVPPAGHSSAVRDPGYVTTSLRASVSIPVIGVGSICATGCSECLQNHGHAALPQAILSPEARAALIQVSVGTKHALERTELNAKGRGKPYQAQTSETHEGFHIRHLSQ